MSFIVYGTKIPVSCDSCPLMRWNTYGPEGDLQYCNIRHAICEHEEGQRDMDCPLVEIPPHGRLIDADALTDNCMKEDGFLSEMLFRKVSNAPTVIEAEEAEE